MDSSSESEELPSARRSPSYIQFTPKRAMASFENLVALANYEERLREARKIVWRDRGERPVELGDIWECLEHASRGGLRAGTLAFAIRSGVNFLLLMTRIKKIPRKLRFTLIRHAVLGEDSVRFAAMLGSFVSIYKFILNLLPILLPSPVHHKSTHTRGRSQFLLPTQSGATAHESPFEVEDDVGDDVDHIHKRSRKARLSMSAQAHQVWLRKKTRRWYSIVAGAIAGGSAIMFEKRNRRTVIAQQLFVRGLQGSYNAFSIKHGVHIPHGDVIIFSLCCGQILYGFLMRPDTLPRSYVRWINTAGKIPAESVAMNRDLVREGYFKFDDIETVLTRRDVTAKNRAELLARYAAAQVGDFGPRVGPCAAVHPALDSCLSVPIDRFWAVFRWMVPIYGALHFIPMLLFKRNVLLRDPRKMLLRAGWGTARSSAFLGVFVVIYQSFFCGQHHLYDALMALRRPTSISMFARLVKLIPQFVVDFVLSKQVVYLGGLLSGLSLFVEEKRRREELAMYVLPRGLESLWVMARGKGLVFRTGEFGEMLLTAVGMGMVMNTYQNDPQHLSGLVRRILYQFVGPN